jgi:antitoxin MazE
MNGELIRIGNSRGVRIPKPLIEQCGLRKRVQLRVQDDCIIISSVRRAREGWDAAFRAAGAAEKDALLLDSGATNEFDRKEWRW